MVSSAGLHLRAAASHTEASHQSLFREKTRFGPVTLEGGLAMLVCPSGLLLMRLVNYRPASYVHDDLP